MTLAMLYGCAGCGREISTSQDAITASARRYHVRCAVDAGVWEPECDHCLDGPPEGHTCPSCGKVTA